MKRRFEVGRAKDCPGRDPHDRPFLSACCMRVEATQHGTGGRCDHASGASANAAQVAYQVGGWSSLKTWPSSPAAAAG